ncbi:ankyrin repeat and SOCS box protein 13-like [Mizuhopecten yessoensis]|uniref:Ankyrin repeat and SOCS box protein 2 n=1 Tax=Mizuhopecten yessoensis TaxID=6573 RepID=A0A210PSN8_MIZYE|nr:ankyrin repeat and SOCS box protein 13-like [Mizuhopecten yessoensis]OWF39466.1 Ankyrin repeat and SOCS box protein 2 [Mizuhopecten yessoensis]
MEVDEFMVPGEIRDEPEGCPVDTCHVDLLAAIHANDSDRAMCILGLGCQQVTLDSGLCWASRYGDVEMVSLLLQNGANPNAEVWGGFTPLIWATIYAPTVETILNLIIAGADINHSSTKRRQTALHGAVIRDKVEFVSALVEGGANLDSRDYLHKTPLLYAVQRGAISCVKLLVYYNCDVTLTGWVEGVSVSPLLHALAKGHLEITRILILAGARFDRPAISQTLTFGEFYATLERELKLEVRPVYLQQHCRVRIRRLLKPGFLQKLRQIELPPLIHRYLLIDEMDV